jgi:hypothetical protein
VGDEELDVGACEEEVPVFPVLPVVPVFPVLPVLPVDPEVEAPPFAVEEEVDPDVAVPLVPVVAVVLLASLALGRSWATTTPIATVAPVAAMTAPRVRNRSRTLARSLSADVLSCSGDDMRLRFLGWSNAPTPTTPPCAS